MKTNEFLAVLIFASFVFFMNKNTPQKIYQKNYKEYQEMIPKVKSMLDDITAGETNYILDETKKTNLYILAKYYDNPKDEIWINIQNNIDNSNMWNPLFQKETT